MIVAARSDAITFGLDHSEEPEDQDQDQNAAKTNIHDTFLLFGFADATMIVRTPFPSLRTRNVQNNGIILPASKSPHLLDFPALASK